MLDGTSWPPLDRLNLRDEDRLVAHVLNEPFPLLMKPLPREPEAQAFTLQGIQALRAAAADALDVVLERVIQDRNDCAAVCDCCPVQQVDACCFRDLDVRSRINECLNNLGIAECHCIRKGSPRAWVGATREQKSDVVEISGH